MSRFSRDEKEQTIQYLYLWRNKEGKTASVEQLIAILKRLDPPQNLLADELQKFTTSELFDMQLNFFLSLNNNRSFIPVAYIDEKKNKQ